MRQGQREECLHSCNYLAAQQTRSRTFEEKSGEAEIGPTCGVAPGPQQWDPKKHNSLTRTMRYSLLPCHSSPVLDCKPACQKGGRLASAFNGVCSLGITSKQRTVNTWLWNCMHLSNYPLRLPPMLYGFCLLYTSDAADE